MKALYCGGCGDLIGMPQADWLPPIRQCGCGHVRARWATNRPHVGQILFHETLDPIPVSDLALLQDLTDTRLKAMRVLTARHELEGLDPVQRTDRVDADLDDEWHEQWNGLTLRLEPILKTELIQDGRAEPLRAWLLGVNNAVLRGAHGDRWRAPNYLEYRDWQNAEGTLFKTYETNIIRVRPGESSDSKMVTFNHLIHGRWEVA